MVSPTEDHHAHGHGNGWYYTETESQMDFSAKSFSDKRRHMTGKSVEGNIFFRSGKTNVINMIAVNWIVARQVHLNVER